MIMSFSVVLASSPDFSQIYKIYRLNKSDPVMAFARNRRRRRRHGPRAPAIIIIAAGGARGGPPSRLRSVIFDPGDVRRRSTLYIYLMFSYRKTAINQRYCLQIPGGEAARAAAQRRRASIRRRWSDTPGIMATTFKGEAKGERLPQAIDLWDGGPGADRVSSWQLRSH
jgi:hypothetical protein